MRYGHYAWLAPLFVLVAAGCSCESMIGELDGGADPSDGGGDLDGADPGPDGDVEADAGPTCPGAGQRSCDGACVNVQIDPQHCGGCGVVCGASEVCVSSGCATSCPGDLDACDGTCVDTDTDNAHCGSCGSACPAGQGCLGGSCIPSIPLGPPPARCVGSGPPIEIGGGEAGACTGAISAATFTHGLCACRDVGVPTLGSNLSIDAYDSSMGPYEPGGRGGSLGVVRQLEASGLVVTGDLTTTGAAGWTVRGNSTVLGDLLVGATLTVQNDLSVGGDAFVGGTVGGGSPATIAGTLHTPSCAGVPGNIDSAACVDATVAVASPCPCDETEILPIEAITRFYADPANHDNGEIGLDPDALASSTAPTRLDLPCGYYHLSQISITSPVVIAVHGRTALFISGSIDVSAQLTLALDPGATLDVYVGGTIRASALRVGTPAFPRASRVYVGGVCDAGGGACTLDADCCSLDCAGGTCAPGGSGPPFSIALTSESDLAGLFYSPNGLFTTSSALEMYGALVVGDYHSGSETRIHYDGAAATTGADCPPPPTLPDAGVPDASVPDGGAPACTTGAPSCGPGYPECEGGYYCITGCCTYFG